MVVKIALAQVTPAWEDPLATLRKVEPFVATAATEGAEIICFPEQFATGWDPSSKSHAQQVNGEIVRTLSNYAKDYKIALLGSLRLVEEGRLFNSSIIANKDGAIIAIYRKVHLFSPLMEGASYHAGENIATARIGGMTFGIAICYDLRFAPLFRIYATAGADCVLVPSAWPASRMEAWELFIRTRAMENQMFVAGINTVGTTPVDRYPGNSIVAGPAGNIVVRAPDTEGVFFADLDPGSIRRARDAIRVEEDRKTGLYHDMARDAKRI